MNARAATRATISGDPILLTQRMPRGRDRILSTQRIPRGRDPIFSTQRITRRRDPIKERNQNQKSEAKTHLREYALQCAYSLKRCENSSNGNHSSVKICFVIFWDGSINIL